MNLRELAVKVVKTLRASGHEAYFAGGCVRDMVMHREPADYDVATSATPDQVRRLFPRTIPVGEQFGVVVVVEEGLQVEIATFRTDGPYTDGRHPATIAFTDVEGDVRRRDFTVNGMMYDPVDEKLIDLVGGRKDEFPARLTRPLKTPQRVDEHVALRVPVLALSDAFHLDDLGQDVPE